MLKKQALREKRKYSIRKNVSGTSTKPRLSVFRSNKFIYAQIIDDVARKTIVGTSDAKIVKGTNVEKASKVGMAIAKLAKENKIETVVFDRNGYRFHGRVKALAEAARESGLKF